MYFPFVWIYHCVLLHQPETNCKFYVEVTTVAVTVFMFTRKKRIVLLDVLVLFRTFIPEQGRQDESQQTVPVLG
jgi:hypothetical protein